MDKDKGPLRVGVWCAVSSKAQATEDKVSLEDQERVGGEFAAAIGGQVARVYRVPGHTRDIIFWDEAEREMEAYRLLREDVLAGRLDVLYGFDIDRLGRDPALSNQVISLVEKHGGEVYLASAPHVVGSKTVGHRYIAAIQAVRAGEDQALRVYRTVTGTRNRVMKRGLLPPAIPLGYRSVRDPATGLVTGYELAELADAVRYATKLFLEGHSYGVIRRRMDESPYRPPTSKLWSFATVYRLLHNDVYAGYPRYEGKHRETISPLIPVVWDAETYQAILRERQRRKGVPYHRVNGGPLSGVMVCVRCGWRMMRYRVKGWWYYRCTKHSQAWSKGVGCHRNNVSELYALRRLSDRLQELTQPGAVEAAVAELEDWESSQRLQEDRDQAKKRLADLEQQRLRVAHALAAGAMDIEIYSTVDDDLRAQMAAAREELGEAEQNLAALPNVAERRQALLALAQTFPTLLKTAEPAEIAALLISAGIRIECEKGEVEIKIG